MAFKSKGYWVGLAVLVLVGCSDDTKNPQKDMKVTVDQPTIVPDQQKVDQKVVKPDLPAGCTRWYLNATATTQEVRNARDVGGWPLATGKTSVCQMVYRGGDTSKLVADCSLFAAMKIKSVLDVRTDTEEVASPDTTCTWANGAKSLPIAEPKYLPDTPENYNLLLDSPEGKAGFKSLFTHLGDAANYPVYIHCVIGRDRAALSTTLILLALGASRQTVIDEFMLSQTVGIPVKQPSLEAFLDHLQNDLGGVEKYLKDNGVTDAQLATLRATMIK